MLVGIDIGGTKTAIAVADDPARILFGEEFPAEPHRGPGHAIERIQTIVRFCPHASASASATFRPCASPKA